MDKNISLIRCNNALSRNDRDIIPITAEPGRSLASLKRHYAGDTRVSISVNGQLIDEARWESSFPIIGDQVLIVPEFGEGGSNDDDKSIYRTALMIGIAVGAYMLFGPAGAALSQPWLGIMMGATMYAGGLLVNALLPPHAPVQAKDDGSYAWSPRTIQEQGVPVPVVFGTYRLCGNVIESFTDINDKGESVLYLLLVLGIGPLKNIYDCRINGQSASYYSLVPETRLGTLIQNPISVFSASKTEYSVNYQVTYEAGAYIYETVGDDFDGIEIEITFPFGLYRTGDDGKNYSYTVDLRIAYRKYGSADWIYLTSHSDDVFLTTEEGYWSFGYYTKSYYNPNDEPVYIWVQVRSGSSNYDEHYEGEKDEDFAGSKWHWRDPGAQYVTETYSYEHVSGGSTKAVRIKYAADITDNGTYEIYVENLTPTLDDDKHGEAMYLSAVREVISVNLEYPRTALVGLSAVATKQLSGSFEFSCMTDGTLCEIWDGAQWIVDASSNNAWVCWFILTRPVFNDDLVTVLRYDGIDPSRLDLYAFLDWALWCDELVPDGLGGFEKRCEFRGVFDSAGNMWEAAFSVCQAGRAVLVWRGLNLTVVVDKPSDPVQLFTAGNINRRTFKQTWLPVDERANELEISYINEDRDYTADQVTAFESGFETDAGPASMQLRGICTKTGAWRAGRYRLACNRYILSTAELETDIDSIACEIGDVILIQHDIPTAGSVGGRIVAATTSTVTLDREIEVVTGKSYQLWMRSSADNTIETKSITNAPGRHTTLTVSIAFEQAPVKYDVYAFGEADKVVKPYRVLNIKPSKELMAVLSLVEYNESIYNTDYLIPAAPTPVYTTLDLLPAVENLAVSEKLYAASDGTIVDAIDVYWERPMNAAYASADVWYSIGGGWQYAGNTTGDTFRIDSITVDTAYVIAVVTVNAAGTKAAVQDSPQARITTLGKAAPPSDVTGFRVESNGLFVSFYWGAIIDLDSWAYELRLGSDWDTASVIVTGIAQQNYDWKPTQSGSMTFLIKAIDTTGNYSTNSASVVFTVTAANAVTSLTAQVVDNNVLLRWVGSPGTYPIASYEVRRGDQYDTAVVIGISNATFSTIFEIESGTYKYWVTAIDSNGLYGSSNSVTATVNQPPDFVLHAEWNDNFTTGTKTNIYYDAALKRSLACVDLSTTWEAFCDAQGITTMQDYLDMGGYAIEPMLTEASYEKTFDIGAEVSASIISVAVDYLNLKNTVQLECTISTSSDNETWSDYVGTWQAFSTDFRYVKVLILLSGASDAVIELNSLNVRCNIKEQSDSGMGTVTDANSGAVVLFQKSFADITSITVTPSGTAARLAVYDYVDTPNPVSFTVYMFDIAGNPATGSFSWQAKGY